MGRSYVEAPQTKMLASHCAACGRPLVDAASVESGMGPDCRANHMRDVECSEAERMEANKLVYQIAVVQHGMDAVQPLARLRELGFNSLADRIEKRCAAILIKVDGDEYLVTAPYNECAVTGWRRIRGRRWDKAAKVNRVPCSQRKALWAFLSDCYYGSLAVGPKGPFVVGETVAKSEPKAEPVNRGEKRQRSWEDIVGGAA